MHRPTSELLGLSLKLRDIEYENERRKHLIQLCVMKAYSMDESLDSGLAKEHKDESKKQSVHTTEAAPMGGHNHETGNKEDEQSLRKRLHEFELRISVLKSQLTTKEQAHEARVDQLERLVDSLQSQLDQNKHLLQNKSQTKGRTVKGGIRPVSSPGVLSIPTASRTNSSPGGSLFLSESPFAESKSGKGYSFSGFGLASVASQASLKLSKSISTGQKDAFSPTVSSTENTPKQPKTRNDEQSLDLDNALSLPDASSTYMAPTNEDMNKPQKDDTFQSANSSFENDKKRDKKKKKKIILFSKEASKKLVESQAIIGAETHDLNSLNYYQDDNFKDDLISPTRPTKLPLESAAEQPAKKRHVFKI